jgi:glycosyltransferase involved in cell wall biosynthesis
MTNGGRPGVQPVPGQARDPKTVPFVSILLPVRNEAGYIGGCLAAVAAQDYPRNRFEVLLVDGESSDDTISEARAAAAGASLQLTCITNPARTTATALNLGIRAAKGEIIIRVDGHARIAPDFVSSAVDVLQRTGAAAAGGPIETAGRGPVGRAIALALSSRFGVGDANFRLATGPERDTDSVPFGTYRRDVFERVGLFTEDIDRGEDDEFNYRLRAAGGRIVLSPAIRSTYYCRDSFPALAFQYWRYGIAKAAVLQRHPEALRPRHLAPSMLVTALTAGLLLSPFNRSFGWLTTLAGGAYIGFLGFASARTAKRDPDVARLLPLAFAAIHLSAGAGLLVGALRQLVCGLLPEVPSETDGGQVARAP